jgi:spore germination protein GerM
MRSGPASQAPAGSTATAGTAAAARKITATLYYVSEDGMSLVGVQREVPYGDTVLEQARHIVDAQLTPAPPPLVSAIPQGAALRALYVTDRGDAFVDLSAEARTMHTGGALDELFTVYSIVNALTTNLPAVTRVQILVDGKEVDTLAGHVDLRHPLQKNLKWVKTDKT